MIKKFNIIFFVIIFALLLQVSNLVFAQESNILFGITFTSFSSNKVGMEQYGIYVPLGDVVYYLQENLSYLIIDTDFINLHLLFQNKSFVYGFEFFYESGVLRGYNLLSVIYPSFGGIFGIRPQTKKGCILFQSTVSIAFGLLFIDVENIKYLDFNIIVRFSHSLYIKIFNQTYFFASLTHRYFYSIDKDSPFIIGQGAFWFGLEWKI